MTRWFQAGSLGAAGFFLVLLAGPVSAQCSCAAGGCGSDGGSGGGGACGGGACGACKHEGPCPPVLKYYYEGRPRIIFKKGCPRPICDPCHLEHFGYYQTCWQPWPYPPDWSHCHTPPPGAALPPPAVPPFSPRVPASTLPRTDTNGDRSPDRGPETPSLPSPRKLTPEREPPPKLGDKPSVRFIE